MEKLIIAERVNWKMGFYIKFKAEEKSMLIIKRIVEELGSDFFSDMHGLPRRKYGNYEKWKDFGIFIQTKKEKIKVNIICGNKYIHMLVDNCLNYHPINSVLEKYSEFTK